MNAKQYLKQAYRLDELIKSDIAELDQLKDLSTSISGIDYSKDKVQEGNAATDARFVNIISRIIDLEQVINTNIDNLIQLKTEIRKTIDAVQNPDERLLLRLKYINFYTWEQVCDEMNFSLRTIHRIHSSALAILKIPKAS